MHVIAGWGGGPHLAQPGFADQSHLMRCFSRCYDITPGGYQPAVPDLAARRGLRQAPFLRDQRVRPGPLGVPVPDRGGDQPVGTGGVPQRVQPL